MKSLCIKILFTSFLSSTFANPVSQSSNQPRVHDPDKNVTYIGVTHKTESIPIESFLNIPFAESVSGVKRFTRPVAKCLEQNEVIDATKDGPACPQQKVPVKNFPFFSNVTDAKEDCLNLRVDRVGGTTGTKAGLLPVMVWIYGGGYSVGQAYDMAYTPDGLLLNAALGKRPIVYVAMNYRLNIFGFAASEALAKEGNTNMGLLDQRLALEWVQQNIRYFGGDPEQVTIFGESDGATSVGLQITAYGGKGQAPFHQGIMESGGPAADTGVASNFSALSTEAVAREIGCAKSSSAETLTCLRAAPYEKLLHATLKYEFSQNQYGFDQFIPTVDGDFIPSPPSHLVRSGQFYNVATMAGWQRDDSSFFTNPKIKPTRQAMVSFFQSSFYPGFNKKTIDALLSIYPASEFKASEGVSGNYYRASRISRDQGDTCQSILLAAATKRYFPSTNAFLYQLDQTPLRQLFSSMNLSYFGVPHFSDIFYVFDTIPAVKKYINVTASDLNLGHKMSGSWAKFAAHRSPGSSNPSLTLGPWPPAFGEHVSSLPSSGPNFVTADSKFAVYAIGHSGGFGGDGKDIHGQGIVITTEKTIKPGFEDLPSRCEFMTTPEFFEQVGT